MITITTQSIATTNLWTFIVGYLARLGTRNAMDANRNDPNYAGAILKLAGQSI